MAADTARPPRMAIHHGWLPGGAAMAAVITAPTAPR